MNEKLLTIFTPVYNRAYCIRNLYRSLVNQESKNFTWYVIDDGSTDDIKNIIQNMINENKIDIIYEFKENEGKHIAHNIAVKNCETKLFFCVDSDDILPKNSVSEIEKEWNFIKSNKKISGIVAYRGNMKGIIIGTEFIKYIEYSGLRQLYDKGKIGDTALIYKTNILKKYPFPYFKGEKFIRENLVYDLIDDNYDLKVCRKVLYMCEYLPDGLSKNATKLEFLSPKGAALYRFNEYKRSKVLKLKVRNLAGYIFFCIKADNLSLALKKIGIIRFILLLPLIIFGGIRYRLILRKNG